MFYQCNSSLHGSHCMQHERQIRLILGPDTVHAVWSQSLQDTGLHVHSFIHYFNKIASELKSSGCVFERMEFQEWLEKWSGFFSSPQEELWWWVCCRDIVWIYLVLFSLLSIRWQCWSAVEYFIRTCCCCCCFIDTNVFYPLNATL